MLDSWTFFLALLCALSSGLIAGVFFAFSAFVMRALARLPPAQGIAAMQSINIVVLNPVFLGVFLGTAVLSAVAVVAALLRPDAPGCVFVLTGGALYLVGTFGVTIAFNVPWNDRLAPVSTEDPAAAETWRLYSGRWTAWNHVRTVAALAASASFTVALASGW
jgi:uncharacterized membrane protein